MEWGTTFQNVIKNPIRFKFRFTSPHQIGSLCAMDPASDATHIIRFYTPEIEELFAGEVRDRSHLRLTIPALISILFTAEHEADTVSAADHAIHTIGSLRFIRDVAAALSASNPAGELALGLHAALIRAETALRKHRCDPSILNEAAQAFAAVLKYANTPTLISYAASKFEELHAAALLAKKKAEKALKEETEETPDEFVLLKSEPLVITNNLFVQKRRSERESGLRVFHELPLKKSTPERSLGDTVATLAESRREQNEIRREAKAYYWLRLLENRFTAASSVNDYLEITARILIDVKDSANLDVLSRAYYLADRAREAAKNLLRQEQRMIHERELQRAAFDTLSFHGNSSRAA